MNVESILAYRIPILEGIVSTSGPIGSVHLALNYWNRQLLSSDTAVGSTVPPIITNSPSQDPSAMKRDPHTVSNTHAYSVLHSSLDWTVDFDSQRIVGSVTLTVKMLEDALKDGKLAPLMLDCAALNVKAVSEAATDIELPWTLDTNASPFGGALRVNLGPTFGDSQPTANFTCKICIKYSTTAEGTALQWLSPAQTAQGTHPFLFSQCQAIHARTMLPCQDAPGARATYDAIVRLSRPMSGVEVLMSANIRESIIEGITGTFRARIKSS
jgi:leukotriene-A4 hydrolase